MGCRLAKSRRLHWSWRRKRRTAPCPPSLLGQIHTTVNQWTEACRPSTCAWESHGAHQARPGTLPSLAYSDWRNVYRSRTPRYEDSVRSCEHGWGLRYAWIAQNLVRRHGSLANPLRWVARRAYADLWQAQRWWVRLIRAFRKSCSLVDRDQRR